MSDIIPSNSAQAIELPDLETQLALLRARLQVLQTEHAAGHLSAEVYESARQAVEQEMVRAVMSGPISIAGSVHGARSTLRPASPVNKRLYLGVGAVVLTIASATYAWVGTPGALNTTVAQASESMANPHAGNTAGDDGQGGMTFEQMRQRTEALAKRLQSSPDDLAGWSMLARSYAVLGSFKESIAAYNKAIALAPKDAQLLADYADTLAMNNGRSLQGEPSQAIAKALKIDPGNLKALALAGTAAFDRKDFAQATQYWERAAKASQPGTPFERQIQTSLSEVKALQGQAATGTVEAGAAKATDAKAAVPQQAEATLRGTVTLGDALRGKTKPEDTLFVFAVPTNGSRMPVAVLRAQVKDLPLNFELNDSLAMSPDMKISGQKQVLLRARISRTGDAMPKAGDLEGEIPTVDVGSRNVQLLISRERS